MSDKFLDIELDVYTSIWNRNTIFLVNGNWLVAFQEISVGFEYRSHVLFSWSVVSD